MIGRCLKYSSATVLLVLSSACVRRPAGVLSDKEMVPVIADIELAEAYLQTQHSFRSDDNKIAMINDILAKHKVSRGDFDSTMAWYGRNPDKYYEFLPLVEKELDARRRTLTGTTVSASNSTDLWPYSRMALVSPLSGSNSFSFSVPTLDVNRGDKVNFKLKFHGRPDVEAYALLGVEYDNGSKGYMHRQISSTRRLDLTLQTDTSATVKRIFGNFILKNEVDRPLWLDSISLTTLPLDTLDYFNIRSQRVYRNPVRRRTPESPDTITR